MTASATSASLLQALRGLLPYASLSVTHERPWCSLSANGTQICLSVIITGKAHRQMAAEFAQKLPEYKFNIGAHLVADIAVSKQIAGDNEICLAVHALLLDD